MPPPKVDSAVIRLSVRNTPKYEVLSEKKFFALVKACFAQRRKTLLNTVSSTLKIEKSALSACLAELGLREDIRAEKLKMEELCALSNLLLQKEIY